MRRKTFSRVWPAMRWVVDVRSYGEQAASGASHTYTTPDLLGRDGLLVLMPLFLLKASTVPSVLCQRAKPTKYCHTCTHTCVQSSCHQPRTGQETEPALRRTLRRPVGRVDAGSLLLVKRSTSSRCSPVELTGLSGIGANCFRRWRRRGRGIKSWLV